MAEAPPLYLALAHHPVYNKCGDKVATAITNVDLHDLARLSRTYGVRRAFVVTPIPAQRDLVARIIGHWVEGEGSERNQDRQSAMRRPCPAPDLDAAAALVAADAGTAPVWVATGARLADGILPWTEATRALRASAQPWLIVFGTGSGLHEDVLSRCAVQLSPLAGIEDGYNHLSVRSAIAIILDRLLGR